MDVPFQEHERALLAALEPWIPVQKGSGSAPDPGGVMTTLPEVSLPALARACQAAVDEGKPYTHVHVLAHGYPIGRAHRARFGMALHSENEDLQAVTPEELEEALAPLVGHAVVVTLATCDAANSTNTATSKRSIAHNLHVLGFPIVVASQLPFTKPGSTLTIETFYKAQLAGEDVRLALHQARVALYQSQSKTGHDWASLVGYVQLPEGYADHLRDVRLQSVLASLKVMQGWSDKLVKQDFKDPALFDRVAQQLQERIVALDRFRKEAEKIGQTGILGENLGLLGSAEKRLAELCFVRSKLGEAPRWQQSMREALQRSRDWYRKFAEKNLSNHWTGVQYLSLEAILDGRIANLGRWYAGVTPRPELDSGRHLGAWVAGRALPSRAPRRSDPICRRRKEGPGGDEGASIGGIRRRHISARVNRTPVSPLRRLVDGSERLLSGHIGSGCRSGQSVAGTPAVDEPAE